MDELKKKIGFMLSVLPFAKHIEQTTGLTARFIMAQVALETGWGQRILEGSDNLFNIKATPSWTGGRKVYYVPEYLNGAWVYSYEPFRTYPSFAESMDDWLNLMRTTAYNMVFAPEIRSDVARVAKVVHEAGYATAPDYADLIVKVAHGPTMTKVFAQAENLEAQARSVAPYVTALI